VVLSIFALVIAALSLAVAIHAERRAARQERRRIEVGCWRTEPGGGAEPMIHVRAVNRGHRPVELRALYFRGLDGSVVRPHMFADDLPKMLHDGESFDAYTDEFKVNEAADAAEVRPTHVAVSDAEGNEYTAPYPPVEFG
jgi:hypothetical protein